MFQITLDYILQNKDWLFSGIGIALVTFIVGLFFKVKSSTPSRELIFVSEGQRVNRLVEPPTKIQETEVEKISKRFRYVLSLMNEGQNYEKFTIPKLAQIMKLHRVSELENVFIGREEASFSFINDFSENFGINSQWLTDGSEEPYTNDSLTHLYPLEYFSDIESLDPQEIFFIRARTKVSEAFILVKITEWKYKIFQRTWHISGYVGGTGSAQLLSFYHLIYKLRESGLSMKTYGRSLDKTDFNQLLLGEKFPGKFLDTIPSNDPWWDDLTDINHEYPISENYEHWYGESFIKAQEIIKRELGKDKVITD